MNRWAKILCLVLALVMLLPVMPLALAEEDQYSDEPSELVILLDCSKSLADKDPRMLRLEAFHCFVDLLDMENARISVVTFGYKDAADAKGFPFSSNYTVAPNDTARTHRVVSSGALDTTEQKNEYKTLVGDIFEAQKNNRDTMTSLGHALASATDMLSANGASDGNAGIILVTDGVYEPSSEREDKALIDKATADAKSHDWPVYCVDLTYGYTNASEKEPAQALLDEIWKKSGNDEKSGRFECAEPDDVFWAFADIFKHFFDLERIDPIDIVIGPEGYAEEIITIPEMTSEATLTVYGEKVKEIAIECLEGGFSETVQDSKEGDRMIAVKGNHSYSIKLLNPDDGQWKITMRGQADAKVKVDITNVREMDVEMTVDPVPSDTVLNKNDTLHVNAVLTYRGFKRLNESFYENNTATLIVTNTRSGQEHRLPMTGAAATGFGYDLAVRDLPVGSYRLQVELEHNMFRRDVKRSNTVGDYATGNLPVEVKADMEPVTLSVYVNGKTDPVDLNQFFHNPDGDELEFRVSCSSHPDRNFEPEWSNPGVAAFAAGLEVGQYEMLVEAKDADSTEFAAATGKLTVSVSNRAPEKVKPLPSVELWCDAYGFQKPEAEKLECPVDPESCFIEPDGMPMTFDVLVGDTAVAELKDGKILPVAEGETTVIVSASDGIDQTQIQFTVKVESGKKIYWEQNWIYYLIALIVVLVIVITVIVLYNIRRVKGSWEIRIDENGNISTIDSLNIANYTRVGKKRHFLFKDLLNEMIPYMANSSQLAMIAPTYFMGTGAEKIEFVGVLGARGCSVTKIPKNDYVKVAVNGVERTGKAQVYGGTLTITLSKADGSGERMVISMTLTNKR